MLRYGERLTLRFSGVAPPEIEGLPNVEFPSEKFPHYTEFARYFSNQSCDIFIAPSLRVQLVQSLQKQHQIS